MKKDDIDIFNFIKDENETINLKSEIKTDDITEEISKAFDYEFKGSTEEKIFVPNFPKDFQIGLIVGSSGSGKTTLLKQCFGNEESIEWDNSKAIASHFKDYNDAVERFGAVGLNSIPTWMKPYRVLSNGEKFRADMARRLKSGAVIDEFTSVVNRECAISCSMSISKYIAKKNLKNIVFCSCHDDIIPYLKPNWVYNTDTQQFFDGRYLRQPRIEIELRYCSTEAWNMFKKYHYLSGDINKASRCYIATYNDRAVAFASILALPCGTLKHAYREHRIVVLPDFQGMGIGNRLSESIAQSYIEKGCRYFGKTSNPRMGHHRDNSNLWKPTAHNHKNRSEYLKNGEAKTTAYTMNAEKMKFHAERVCFCHEYVGDGTKYPYTLEQENINDEAFEQMTIFDIL